MPCPDYIYDFNHKGKSCSWAESNLPLVTSMEQGQVWASHGSFCCHGARCCPQVMPTGTAVPLGPGPWLSASTRPGPTTQSVPCSFPPRAAATRRCWERGVEGGQGKCWGQGALLSLLLQPALLPLCSGREVELGPSLPGGV